MKEFKNVFWISAIIVSLVVSMISVKGIYTQIKDRKQREELARYLTDYTIDEDRRFSENTNYVSAIAEYKKKEYKNAIAELNEEIKKYPDHAQAYYLLGKIYEEALFKEGGFYSKMSSNYENYIRLKPKGKRINDAKIKTSQYYIYLGLVQGEQVYLDKAEKYLKELDQSDDTVKMSLGAIYLDKHNFEQAIALFEKSTTISMADIKIKYNSLGLAYIRQGYYSKAENALEIALKINPDNAYAHNNLGVVYVKQRKLIEARQQFLEALKLDSNYERAKSNLAWLDKEMKRR
jgi:tetratricopeptide (TPR) repeat protein